MSTWTQTRPVVEPGPTAPRRVVLPRAGLSRWLLLLLAGLSIHCGDDPRPEEAGGVLRFAWAMGEAGGAGECERLAAVAFRGTIFHRGQIIDNYFAPCTDFELETRVLAANVEYTARATLVDELEVAKSPTFDSTRFDIAADEVVDITIDFDVDGGIIVGPIPPVPIQVIR